MNRASACWEMRQAKVSRAAVAEVLSTKRAGELASANLSPAGLKSNALVLSITKLHICIAEF